VVLRSLLFSGGHQSGFATLSIALFTQHAVGILVRGIGVVNATVKMVALAIRQNESAASALDFFNPPTIMPW
jgi:hypothetical protein